MNASAPAIAAALLLGSAAAPRAPGVTVDPNRLKAHVERISSDFVPRSHLDARNLDRCADYILGEFGGAGAKTAVQPYEAGGRRYRNVFAVFPGASDSRVVVGAHYDACGATPGADDNASGVAGLIELARLCAGRAYRDTVELAAYCTEEPPFFGSGDMGSARHARLLDEQGRAVTLMIALEMIGCFTDEKGSQGYPSPLFRLFYPDRGNFISVVGRFGERGRVREVAAAMARATDLPVRSAALPACVAGVDFSDHRSFWEHGFPAVMVTDTAFHRNRAYHGADDTADRLDYARMAKVVAGVFEAIGALCGDKGRGQPPPAH